MDFNSKISASYVMVLALAGALLDFLVMGYWIGIFHHYDPGTHSPVATPLFPPHTEQRSARAEGKYGAYNEFTFGAGALNRYTQLIVASFLCLLTHGAAGLSMKFKMKSLVQKMFILALCARAFWFYVETRQMLLSAKTAVRRQQEVDDWIKGPLLEDEQERAMLNEKSPPKHLIQFFNGECFAMDEVYLQKFQDSMKEKERRKKDRQENKNNNDGYNNDRPRYKRDAPGPAPGGADGSALQVPDGKTLPQNETNAGNMTGLEGKLSKDEDEEEKMKKPKIPTPESCNFEFELPIWDIIFINIRTLFSIFLVLAFTKFLGDGADIGPEPQVFPENAPLPQPTPSITGSAPKI